MGENTRGNKTKIGELILTLIKQFNFTELQIRQQIGMNEATFSHKIKEDTWTWKELQQILSILHCKMAIYPQEADDTYLELRPRRKSLSASLNKTIAGEYYSTVAAHSVCRTPTMCGFYVELFQKVEETNSFFMVTYSEYTGNSLVVVSKELARQFTIECGCVPEEEFLQDNTETQIATTDSNEYEIPEILQKHNFTITEISEIMGISRQAVYNQFATGKLKKTGGKVNIDDFVNWLKFRQVENIKKSFYQNEPDIEERIIRAAEVIGKKKELV